MSAIQPPPLLDLLKELLDLPAVEPKQAITGAATAIARWFQCEKRELRGLARELGVRSRVSVPLDIAGVLQGVQAAAAR